jgi:hypothetical protein
MNLLETLFAVEQIRTLKARYFRFVDTKKWNELRALFTDDATVFFPEGFDAPRPIPEAMKFIAEVLDSPVVSVHSGYMPEIEIVDQDHAKAIWPMQDHMYWSSEKQNPFGVSEVHGAGHYHETYRREHGQWRISSLKLTRLRRAIVPLPTACA